MAVSLLKESHLEMHLMLCEGVMISPETNLVVPATVKVAEAHAVHPLPRALPNIRHIDRPPQPSGGRLVQARPHQRCEQPQKLVEADVVRCQWHIGGWG